MRKNIGPVLWFIAALITVLAISPYLTFDPSVSGDQFEEKFAAHPIALYVHIIGGIVGILLGPWQFMPDLRTRHITLHRGIGTCYLIGCVSSGIAGLIMATRAFGGFPAGMGFGLLAVSWLSCNGFALQRVLTHRYAQHREWMIRSYALTLAAFTLRISLLVYSILLETGVISLPFIQMYTAIAWLCWVPNIIVAEWYINASRGRAHHPKSFAPRSEILSKT